MCGFCEHTVRQTKKEKNIKAMTQRELIEPSEMKDYCFSSSALFN